VKDLELHSYWRSSCAWRVRIALALKRLEYRYRAVHLMRDGGRHRAPEFAELNPMQQVPLLTWREGDQARSLGQSLAIVRFLDQVAPEPPLVPADAYEGALAWQLAEVVNAGIQPLQNLSNLIAIEALGGDRKVYGAHAIAGGLAAMERMVASRDDEFLVGDRPSVADLCLVPQLYNARRFGVDLDPFPTLVRVETTCAALPAFAAAHPDAQPDFEEAP
jgi:maleylpyruvate isomerase